MSSLKWALPPQANGARSRGTVTPQGNQRAWAKCPFFSRILPFLTPKITISPQFPPKFVTPKSPSDGHRRFSVTSSKNILIRSFQKLFLHRVPNIQGSVVYNPSGGRTRKPLASLCTFKGIPYFFAIQAQNGRLSHRLPLPVALPPGHPVCSGTAPALAKPPICASTHTLVLALLRSFLLRFPTVDAPNSSRAARCPSPGHCLFCMSDRRISATLIPKRWPPGYGLPRPFSATEEGAS